MPPPRVKFISDKANQTSTTVAGRPPFSKKVKIDDNSFYLILEDGAKMYYKNEILHRDGAPAIEYPNGSKEWYRNGKLHRGDGPAREMFIEETNIDTFPEGEPSAGSELHDITIEVEKENSGKKVMEWYLEGKKLEIIPEEMLDAYCKDNNLTRNKLLQIGDNVVVQSIIEANRSEFSRFKNIEF